jgi:hypothetical protein
LPKNIRCFALAGVLGQAPGSAKGRLLGDGLVPQASALGRHAKPAHSLAFAPDRLACLQGIGHLDLLSRPEAAAQLLRWLR